MVSMILKMSGVTLLYVLLTIVVWFWTKDKEITRFKKLVIGIVFGISSVLSTHFGIQYEKMIINVRDIGPLAAGLFFSPGAGVIAGLIGGIERYIAGTYFGVSSYTRIACSISTCLAGFVAMGMKIKVFKGKKPSPFYAFFMGAVMEVFHMYVVFITHRDDMRMAFLVVSTCSIPMIIFTGIGLSVSSIILQVLAGEWHNPFAPNDEEKEPLSQKFQKWLFIITSIVILSNFLFSFLIQTQSAMQDCETMLDKNVDAVRAQYEYDDYTIKVDNSVWFGIIDSDRRIIRGKNQGIKLPVAEFQRLTKNMNNIFRGTYWGEKAFIYAEWYDKDTMIVTAISEVEVYWHRDADAYESGFSNILLFTVIYVLIAYLVNQIVVNNIHLINESLSKITNGNLNEVVTVRTSSEFASLSDDINQTVLTLKGYIAAAEKKIEQELILARTIQASSLPQVFSFPDRDEFELFATMKPAKEVGGDFYDFFFVDINRIALVIADVSGKGIPAALFMMRSKTAIRSFTVSGGTPEEILAKTNETLCEGNEAEMFVTVWIGIIDLTTGLMQCANAGHEYPVIRHGDGDYELFKDKHSLALAAMPVVKSKPYEIQLQPGDRIFVYTDGVPEAINKDEKQYGTERMLQTLNSVKEKSITDTLPEISESIKEFKGDAEQFDDITMLGFEYVKPLVWG
ncbi:5TMR of 5TMR-LYT [Pseudobutyrivibrio sp. ACV-2]|uniref:SpoIIE family protein phosphatase n=1 Tax=Pseudobutyrivibrio sp. ACV-2 TaxID=1520801 RepID=UPI00089D78F6|nr:SpoIIE family protein phosphatase [Pseudobutyrivibrio sp. ACV-2]SEA93806.1 5TMR of 5TMR-LYT [Pseudobutyrivibrio sp. ACV-2]